MEVKGSEFVVSKRNFRNNQIEIELQVSEVRMVNFRVVNIIGEVRSSFWKELKVGYNSISMNITGLPKGSYQFLIIDGDGNTVKERFNKY